MTHPLQDRDAFKAARHALGMSTRDVAAAMHLRDERTVRGWESGRNDIPGPAAVLMELWTLHSIASGEDDAEASVEFTDGRAR